MCSVNYTKLHRNKAQVLGFLLICEIRNVKKLLYKIRSFIHQKLITRTMQNVDARMLQC